MDAVKYLVALLLLCTGCFTRTIPSAESHDTQYLCWSKDLNEGAPAWRDEAAKRFPGALVLVSHGSIGGSETLRWTIDVDADALAEFLKHEYPNRPIVFVSCNPLGATLHVSGVWYAKDLVWLPPDSARVKPRDLTKEPGVGSINEFVEGHP